MLHHSRYELIAKLASGGMATVYVGLARGPLGFSRVVAIKRAHPHLLEEPDFAGMFQEEARLASRIRHPNVVAVHDVEHLPTRPDSPDLGELYLVMDYVEGASLAQLMKRVAEKQTEIPPSIAVRIFLDVCAGLEAAHRLTDDDGVELGIVHRDVTPHNLLVGVDGMARVTDFGIARITTHPSFTRTGIVKGKLEYMSPETLAGKELDQRSDVFSLGIILWETLDNRRLFRGDNDLQTMRRVAAAQLPAWTHCSADVARSLGPVVLHALQRERSRRFASVNDFASALETAARKENLVATHAEVGAYVEELMHEDLSALQLTVRRRISELQARPNTMDTTLDLPLNAASVTVGEANDEIVPSSPVSNHPSPTQLTATSERLIPELVGITTPPPRRRLSTWAALALGLVVASVIAFGLTTTRSGTAPLQPARGALHAWVAAEHALRFVDQPSTAQTTVPGQALDVGDHKDLAEQSRAASARPIVPASKSLNLYQIPDSPYSKSPKKK